MGSAVACSEDLRRAGIVRSVKIKDLTESDMEKHRDEVARFTVEGDLRREVTMNIKRLMDLAATAASVTVAACRFAVSTRTNARTRKGPRKPIAGKK